VVQRVLRPGDGRSGTRRDQAKQGAEGRHSICIRVRRPIDCLSQPSVLLPVDIGFCHAREWADSVHVLSESSRRTRDLLPVSARPLMLEDAT
jgi:hypothetical protein